MHKKRILLAEGEKNIADRLSKVLIAAQYDVDQVFDEKGGRQLFDKHTYDLAIIDFKFPDVNGRELCCYIRNRDANIPLIGLSSGTSEDNFDAFQSGVDVYMLLSDDFRELLLRIKVLEKRSFRTVGAKENSLIFGDILVDLDSKEVKRGDRLIILSAREFLLLQYLINNKNRVVSAHEIACTIWGNKFKVKEERVSAFINSLRKKMKEKIFQKYIYTVTGKGYLLIEVNQ